MRQAVARNREVRCLLHGDLEQPPRSLIVELEEMLHANDKGLVGRDVVGGEVGGEDVHLLGSRHAKALLDQRADRSGYAEDLVRLERLLAIGANLDVAAQVGQSGSNRQTLRRAQNLTGEHVGNAGVGSGAAMNGLTHQSRDRETRKRPYQHRAHDPVG
ncbi:MAG: hypothetical protein FJ191_02050 [Gammaproteobacteria bacterium]|nr:hypothetical protein [Gammaproteobacteria bacterium]